MGVTVIDWGCKARFGEGGLDPEDIDWLAFRWLDTATTNLAFTRAQAVTLHAKANTSFAAFDSEADSVFGNVYSNDPEGARKALGRSFQLLDPEDAGADGVFAGSIRWFGMPLFCEGETELEDVIWYCSRRESGETPIDITVTRQEAYDLAVAARVSFTAFDSEAGSVLGADYSGDTEDGRKCLWLSFERLDPEDPS